MATSVITNLPETQELKQLPEESFVTYLDDKTQQIHLRCTVAVPQVYQVLFVDRALIDIKPSHLPAKADPRSPDWNRHLAQYLQSQKQGLALLGVSGTQMLEHQMDSMSVTDQKPDPTEWIQQEVQHRVWAVHTVLTETWDMLSIFPRVSSTNSVVASFNV